MHRKIDFKKVTERQKRPIPDDWREMLASVPDRCALIDIQKRFGVSHSCLHRWRKENPQLDEAVLAKLKAKNNSHKRKKKDETREPSEVLIDLRMMIASTTNREARALLEETLALVEQLRRDLRAAKSEAQIARERLHFRASGRANGTHATGGGAELQALAASDL